MYLKGFAEAVLNGEVTMDKFAGMTDSEITKQLIKIKGLASGLRRCFCFWRCAAPILPLPPILFFQKRVKEIFNLNAMPKRKQILELTEHWRRGVHLPYGICGRKNNKKTKRLCRKI